MHALWTDIELEEQWSLEDCERQTLLPGKSQGQRLAVAALLKFYQLAGRFPDNLREVPEVALKYLHKSLILVSIRSACLLQYSLSWWLFAIAADRIIMNRGFLRCSTVPRAFSQRLSLALIPHGVPASTVYPYVVNSLVTVAFICFVISRRNCS